MILARNLATSFFGVNISGPEFPSGHANFGFPSDTDWNYLLAKGIRFVRLPIAWEQLQPTLGGALDTTYLGLITTALSKAAARGQTVLVDLHNFGRYSTPANYASSGYPGLSGSILGDGTLTQAVFVDLWQKLSTALVGRAGLGGYDIMNEPHDLVGTNLLTQPNGFDYVSGLNAAWFVTNAAVVTGQVGTGPLGANDAVSLTSGTGFGGVFNSLTTANVQHTYSFYAKTTSGTEPFTMYADGDIGSGAKTATTSWQRFTATWTPTAASHQIGIAHNSAAGHTIWIADAQVELGASATAYVSSPWQPHAQAAVTAIRVIDATTPIYVGGYTYSAATPWKPINGQLAITGGGIVYQAHLYFDGNAGGTYAVSYDAQGATPTLGADRVAQFIDWLSDNSFTGYIGEFGVPNDDARWVTLLNNFLAACYAAGVPGSEWFYGTFSAQDGGRLNIAKSANGGNDAPQMATLVSYTTAPSYDADATAFFAYAGTLSGARKTLISNLIAGIKSDWGLTSLSQGFDVFWLPANETSTAALKNIAKNDHHLTAVNSPTFTADQGYAGNGTTSYLATDFVPATDGIALALNNSHLSVYVRTNRTSSDAMITVGGVDAASERFEIDVSWSNVTYMALSSAYTTIGAATTAQGFWIADRSASNAVEMYRNGVSVNTAATASSGLTSVELYIGGINNNGALANATTDQIAFVSAGRRPTGAEKVALNTRIETYMDAIGAGVI